MAITAIAADLLSKLGSILALTETEQKENYFYMGSSITALQPADLGSLPILEFNGQKHFHWFRKLKGECCSTAVALQLRK